MIADYTNRPVVVLGAGVLGRGIAAVFVAGGYTVYICDPSTQVLNEASAFIDANRSEFSKLTTTKVSGSSRGSYRTFTEIKVAAQSAWLVVEAVPEKLPLKIQSFAEVDQYAPDDCLIASNSSSFKSRMIMEKVKEVRKKRVLNMHFYMPPDLCTVELMTSGQTEDQIFPFLSEVLSACGMVPVTAKKESTGLVSSPPCPMSC